MAGLLRVADRAQKRHRWLAFPVAVLVKFADDAAGGLAAQLAYYAFFAVFPALLVLVTLLDLVLRNDSTLQQHIVHSALIDFPIIGPQLVDNVHSLHRTGVGLAAGLVGSVFGARGFAATAQRTLSELWDVPYVRRPQFPASWLRQLGMLVIIATGVLLTGVLSAVASGIGHYGSAPRVVAFVLSLGLNVAIFVGAFRVGTARAVPTRDLVTSALATAVVWQLLLAGGGVLVNHQLRHASQLYGLFGLVLGLLAWVHLQAQVTVIAIEADVVRSKRLWPRTMSDTERTAADERALTDYAETEQRHRDEDIDVTFDA